MKDLVPADLLDESAPDADVRGRLLQRQVEERLQLVARHLRRDHARGSLAHIIVAIVASWPFLARDRV